MILAVGIWWVAAAAGVPGTFAEAWGPETICAIAGNGGLTVGVDRSGRIALCRWPSPGYYNQVRYLASHDAPAPLGDGLMWGLRIDDRTLWLCGEPWETRVRYEREDTGGIEIARTLSEPKLAVTERIHVHPGRDLLILRLTVSGCSSAPALYWYANFSPCTRLIPEAPIADWALDACNDFAVFTADGGGTFRHFRPNHPNAGAWRKADELAASHASLEAWTAFGDGVWIAYASPNKVAGFRCEADSGALAASLNGPVTSSGPAAATGPCHSVIALTPVLEGQDYVATVFAAFGKNDAEAASTLAYATQQGYDALVDDTRNYWLEWLRPAVIPNTDDAPLLAACKRDLMTLAMCTDRASYAVVRSPSAQPPRAMDSAEDGAWATMAYSLAGYREMARTHSLFYGKTIRAQDEPCKPRGSLPAATYANGVDALPSWAIRPEAAAWMLGSFWQTGSTLDTPERHAYLEEVWEYVKDSGDFLTRWTDARTRQPLYSFSYEAGRDTQSTELVLATCMGIDAAIRIAAALGRPVPPEWTHRKRQLDSLVLFCGGAPNTQWRVEDILPYWREEFDEGKPPEMPFPTWDAVMQRKLTQLPSAGARPLETLCDAAVLWEKKPARLVSLRPLLDATTPKGLEASLPECPASFVDAWAAARHFIAASLIYAPSR